MYYACVTSGAGHTRTRAVFWHFLTAFMPCRAGQTFGATVLLATATTHCEYTTQRICIHGTSEDALRTSYVWHSHSQFRIRFRGPLAETSCELSSYALYCACAAHLHSRKTHFRTSQCRGPLARAETSFRFSCYALWVQLLHVLPSSTQRISHSRNFICLTLSSDTVQRTPSWKWNFARPNLSLHFYVALFFELLLRKFDEVSNTVMVWLVALSTSQGVSIKHCTSILSKWTDFRGRGWTLKKWSSARHWPAQRVQVVA